MFISISDGLEVEIHILHFVQNSTSRLEEDSLTLSMDPFLTCLHSRVRSELLLHQDTELRMRVRLKQT